MLIIQEQTVSNFFQYSNFIFSKFDAPSQPRFKYTTFEYTTNIPKTLTNGYMNMQVSLHEVRKS